MPPGSDEPEEPELPPGDGRPGELRPPPPALPEDPPDEPPPEDDGAPGDGIEVEEDWLAQPPMRSAETALTPATYAAPTSRRFSGCRVFIASPSLPVRRTRTAAGAAKTVRLVT
jgi:hypothetical protein